MKSCPKCQTKYDDKFEFCHHCGQRLQNIVEKTFCPYCGNKLDVQGEYCPFCGKSLIDENLNNKKPKPAQNIKKPSVPELNIKKNYVKMRPLDADNDNKLSWKETFFQGGLMTYIIYCVLSVVICGSIYNLVICNICMAIILFMGWNTAREYFEDKKYIPLIATVLIFLITIGLLGIIKSAGQAEVRKRILSQHPITIVNDIALLK